MNLRDFGLLTDENIHPAVSSFLRSEGFDVLDAKEEGLIGTDDSELLRLAWGQQRVVVTHDRDFGELVVARMEPLIGIIFLRPGHISADFTIDTISELFSVAPPLTPPFVLVAERSGHRIRIRLRYLGL